MHLGVSDICISELNFNSRPINIDELFPDREKMDTSYVEVIRKFDTPIIVITEDSEGEYDVEEEFDSDSEIVELEKKRGVSVQKDVINEEEAEEGSVNECLEEKELENKEKELSVEVEKEPGEEIDNKEKEPSIAVENETEEAIENKEKEQSIAVEKETEEENIETEESNTEQAKTEQNDFPEGVETNVSADPVTQGEDTVDEKDEGQAKEEIVRGQSEQIQEQHNDEQAADKPQIKRDNPVEKTDDAKIESEVPAKIDRDLLEKLVSLHGGWHDAELKKNIKQTAKGWQLISV